MSDQAFDVDTVPFGLARFGFLELTGGRFLALAPGMKGSVSEDRGRTWGEPSPLVTRDGAALIGRGTCGILRLASGRLAIQYMRAELSSIPSVVAEENGIYFATSADEGQTWSEECRVNLPGASGWPYYDVMIQTKSGRLVLPVRAVYAGRRSEMKAGTAWGTVKGHKVNVAGHAHYPELDIAYVYYSDDEGQTWRQSENHVLGWPDDGTRGTYATDEPTVAQASDGRLLMFARSTLGRVIEAWSDDDGTSWSRGLPNALCNSYSPVRLRAIPPSGDLHCVWNQVIPDEIRRGFRRSRLTSAISKDNGATWQHFKMLDCAEPLDKTPRQEPDPSIEFVVADRDCGDMPEDYCVYRYPNVAYVGDTVYIGYSREAFKYSGAPAYQFILRAMPIEALYDDSQSDISLPNVPAEDAPVAKGEDIES